MRKILFFFAIGALFISCQTLPPNPEKYATKTVFWDESMSKEQCVGLAIQPGLTITSYNGIPVKWEKGTMVYLPPGKINLILDVNYSTGNKGYQGKNWPFQWDFNAGEQRYLMGWEKDGEPVILVIEGGTKVKFFDQPYYKLPPNMGPTILE